MVAQRASAMNIDDHHWPLVVQTFDGLQTDEDVERFLANRAKIYARAAPFVTMTYIGAYSLNTRHISRLAEATKASTEAKVLCRGAAIVVPSPSFRFVISAFYLIAKIPYPHIVCDDTSSAETWLCARLTDALLPIPERLRTASNRPRADALKA
jgi:hypothetical protein